MTIDFEYHEPDESEQSSPSRRIVLRRASDIKPRRVRWLWAGRFALGTLALFAGREAMGKSSISAWLTAQITRGTLPGECEGRPRAVLICATEDSWEHTIVPRLMAAGADLSLVYQVEVLSADDVHVGLSLPRDLHQMEQTATETGAALLVLDPLTSRLGESLDTHKDADVRRALEPLVAIADRAGMTVLGLMHHNKSGSTDPLQLVMGSKAFTAVARSVHTAVPDPDDETETRRLFGTPKNNLGPTDLPTLSFTLAPYAVETDDGTAWTGHVVWGSDSSASIGDAMRHGAESPDDKSAVGEAAGWLADYIELAGGVAASADIKKAGARAGHAEHNLKRARQRLRLAVDNVGKPRVTFWRDAAKVSEHVTTASARSEHKPAGQSEHQSGHTSRGEVLTVLTVPTEDEPDLLGQSEQSEQSGRTGDQTCSKCSRDLTTAVQLTEGLCRMHLSGEARTLDAVERGRLKRVS